VNAGVIVALAVAAAALVAVRKGLDVRLTLILAGLVLASAAGVPWKVFDAFQSAVGNGGIIGPICSAMGFAYVLKATGADREMVLLLTSPLRRVKWLLIPGGVAIGFITNMAITSQTASAAALGPILVPLMLAAGYRPLTAAATLLVGCSVGGNLFNPGEPDIATIKAAAGVLPAEVINAAVLPNLLAVAVAAVVLIWMFRADDAHAIAADPDAPRIHLIKALLPPLPVVILLALQPGLNLVPAVFEVYPSGLSVSMVMLICAFLAMMVDMKGASHKLSRLSDLTNEFFQGMGYAFAKVISIILAAACFIGGLEALGVIAALAGVLSANHAVAAVISPVVTWSIAVLGGSGTAASVAFSKSMVPALAQVDVAHAVDLGVAGAIGANVGRTMSPVAAVVLFTSALAEVPIADLVKSASKAMLAALAAVILYGLFS